MPDIAIETPHLTKAYGNKTALKDLVLTVPEGEILGLLGHNGAGKTTIVNLLTTLLSPTSGSAEICGKDITHQPIDVQRNIGYLPENVQFYDNLTVLENHENFGKLSSLSNPRKRIVEVLELREFTDHNTEKLATFSKGMRQRVGIAQAILHHPKVLFLDEPTSGLDPQGVKGVRDLILKLNHEAGITIFMNTHPLSEVTRTRTSIGILRSGTLIYQNTLDDTLRQFKGDTSLEDIYMKIDKSS